MEIKYPHKLCSVLIQTKFLRIEWTQWPDCYMTTQPSVSHVVILYRWDKCHFKYKSVSASILSVHVMQVGAFLAEFKDIYG